MAARDTQSRAVPTVGQKCRLVGGCRKRLLGKVVDVLAVYEANGQPYADISYFDERAGDLVTTSGPLDGLEPVEE